MYIKKNNVWNGKIIIYINIFIVYNKYNQYWLNLNLGGKNNEIKC